MSVFQPLVSVIIPTYNRVHYVTEAVDSVLAQTYKNYEIIVVDDGSTDGTGEALAAKYGDKIRYAWQENQGESVARNNAVVLGTGEFVALLDSDDLWLPEKIERQVKLMEAADPVVLVCSFAYAIDKHGAPIDGVVLGSGLTEHHLHFESLLFENLVIASTALIRRSALTWLPIFDSEIRYGEDWDLWLRLRSQGEFRFISQPLAKIRRHENNQQGLPRVDRISRVLRDHLRIGDKALADSTWSGKEVESLRARFYAKEHAQAGLAYFTYGNWSKAIDHLDTAITLDPETWREEAKLLRAFISRGLAEFALGYPDPEKIRKYLRQMRNAWQAQHVISSWGWRRLEGYLCEQEGYRRHLAQDYPASRAHILSAYRVYPPTILNRGNLRRLIQGVI